MAACTPMPSPTHSGTLLLLYRLLWPAIWPALIAEAVVLAMIVHAGW
jgi:hypothetical protein